MKALETINYQGYQIVVYYDEDCTSPREDMGNLATLVCDKHPDHPDWKLGDRQGVEQAVNELFEKYVPAQENPLTKLRIDEKIDLILQSNEVLIFPLSDLRHSSIPNIWVGIEEAQEGAKWDCGNLGIAYVEKESVECHGDWETVAENAVVYEVERYNAWLDQICYSYRVHNKKTGKPLCSGYGYVGDDEYYDMIEDAKNNIDIQNKHN